MFKMSTRLLKNLQRMLFPPACPVCATSFECEEDVQHAQGGCCAACLQGIHIFSPHTCLACGIPLPASLAPGPCGSCLSNALPQQSTQSLYVYRDTVRQALLAWKLEGQSTGLSWLLHTSSDRLKQIFTADDLLIPVPMPIHRMRRSGLHHSADLCQHISQITGAQVNWQILRRKGSQQRQSALSGKARNSNLRKAFTLADDYKIKLEKHANQRRIWVVDDILTTGATLRHACRAMRPVNRPILAFSLARAIRNKQEINHVRPSEH
ncbi:MAG: double zinc ribbon domain-containing protein [Ghiorsea sp.]